MRCQNKIDVGIDVVVCARITIFDDRVQVTFSPSTSRWSNQRNSFPWSSLCFLAAALVMRGESPTSTRRVGVISISATTPKARLGVPGVPGIVLTFPIPQSSRVLDSGEKRCPFDLELGEAVAALRVFRRGGTFSLGTSRFGPVVDSLSRGGRTAKCVSWNTKKPGKCIDWESGGGGISRGISVGTRAESVGEGMEMSWLGEEVKRVDRVRGLSSGDGEGLGERIATSARRGVFLVEGEDLGTPKSSFFAGLGEETGQAWLCKAWVALLPKRTKPSSLRIRRLAGL